MFGFIYETTNTVNGKKYIGKRIYDKRGQWKSYLGSGSALRKAIKKYGKYNFKRTIICECETEEELNKAEIYYIKYFNAVENRQYYNFAAGGEGASSVIKSPETLEKMSKAISNSFTEERRKQYSKRMKQNNPNRDGHYTKGKHPTAEQIEKRRKKMIGRPGLSGEKNGMYGKRGELNPSFGGNSSSARKVRCIETNEIFNTLKDAGIKYNISSSQIGLCCRGKNKTAAKLHWEYIDNKQPKILSDKSRKLFSERKMNGNNKMSKPVICEDTGELFLSAYEAGRKYGVTGEAVSAACKKKNKSCCKMVWRYATDFEIYKYKQTNSIAR